MKNNYRTEQRKIIRDYLIDNKDKFVNVEENKKLNKKTEKIIKDCFPDVNVTMQFFTRKNADSLQICVRLSHMHRAAKEAACGSAGRHQYYI